MREKRRKVRLVSKLLREVMFEERRFYYLGEWDVKKLLEFIVESIEWREFGFDYMGEGLSDRKNVFLDVRDFEDYIRVIVLYVVYFSVVFYRNL